MGFRMSYQRAVLARVFLCLASVVVIAGCNKQSVKEEYDSAGKVKSREFAGVNADYVAYTQAWERAVTASAAPAVVDLSTCTDDRCRENIHAQAMIAKSSGGGQQMPALAPPPEKKSAWREFTGGLSDVLRAGGPVAVALDAGKTARHAQDASVQLEGIRTGGTVRMFETQAQASAQQSADLASLGRTAAENAGARINMGNGSLFAPNAGVAQIGPSAGRDMLGEGANSGTQTTTTTTTNTTVENGAIVERSQDVQIEQGEGDQRVESPGPYTDDHSNDGDCDGTEADCSDNSGGGP